MRTRPVLLTVTCLLVVQQLIQNNTLVKHAGSTQCTMLRIFCWSWLFVASSTELCHSLWTLVTAARHVRTEPLTAITSMQHGWFSTALMNVSMARTLTTSALPQRTTSTELLLYLIPRLCTMFAPPIDPNISKHFLRKRRSRETGTSSWRWVVWTLTMR